MGDIPASRGGRPSSSAGVHVTDIPAGKSNPSPVAVDETELLIEEFLSPRKLRALTGIDDLEEVKYLEMRVDTSETSLGNFGALLPNLTQLKLNNSIIASVRDLGSSFPLLRILWMPRCNLEDLDGVTAMVNLKELYLAYNDITDLSPLSLMTQLQILDLEGNNISDIYQIEFLSLCSNMKNLTLEGNPICMTPHPEQTAEGYDYRKAVCKTVQSLQLLDDFPVTNQESVRATPSNFDSDWNFLEELQKDGTIESLETMEETESTNLATAPIRPTTGYRPGTSIRPSSAMKRIGTARIIGTADTRPKTAQRPTSSDSGTCADTISDASDLTAGSLIFGNPARALRDRRKKLNFISDHPNANSVFEKYKHIPEHSYPEADETEDVLLDELRQWKIRNESVHKKLSESRAPNVLTIDHTQTISNSDSEGEDREDEDQGFVSRQDNQASDDDLQLSPNSGEATRPDLGQESPRLQPVTTIGARRKRFKAKDVQVTSNVVEESGDFRPISGPVLATGNFRSPVNKHMPKGLPLANGHPVIVRADINSPEKPVIDRSSRTAKAAIFSSASLKKRKLNTLPSRPTVPK